MIGQNEVFELPERPGPFPDEQAERRGIARVRARPERLWLLLGLTWIAAVTLAPFELSYSRHEMPTRIEQVFRLGDSDSPLKLVAHVVSFCALGILVGGTFFQKGRLGWWVAAGFIGCLILETAQLFQLGRHARITDLVLNTIAFGFGLWFSIRTTRGQRWMRELRTVRSGRPIAATLALAGGCGLWWTIGLQPACGALQMNWDPSFPLTIGNEIGGARPWLGRIRYAGVYDRALSPAVVRRFHESWEESNGRQLRQTNGLLVGYDFGKDATGEIAAEGNVKSHDLDLLLPASSALSSDASLTDSRSGVIRSRGAATPVAAAITSTGAFSVEALVEPQDLLQAGPARLVSMSSGPAERNFTLGQSGADLVLRVRNRINSTNGNIHELTAPAAVHPGVQHVIATYDHGVSTIFNDGKRCATIDLREPIFHSRLATGAFARIALICLAVLTISLSALSVLERRLSSPGAWTGVLIFTAIAGVLPYLISCWVVGGPWRLGFVEMFLVALLVLFPIAVAFVSTRQNVPH